MSSLGHGIRITRIDVTRMVRKRTGERSLEAMLPLVLYGVLLVAATLLAGWGGRTLGRAVASGSLFDDPANLVTAVRGMVGVFWLIGVVMFALRSVGQRGTLTNADGILTVVPTGEAYLGIVAAEYVYLLVWTLAPGVGLGVGFALGSDALLAAATVPLLFVLAGTTLVATGFLVGLAVRHVITRFPFVARHRTWLVVLAFVAYFAFILTGSLNRVIGDLFDPLAASPVGWYADVALVGIVPAAANTTYAVGAVLTTVVLAPVATLAGVWVAQRHWFADPALAGEEPSDAAEFETADTGQDRFARVLERGLDRSTAALVTLAWRRAIRSPLKLLYAAYPLLFLVGVFADVLQTGEVPAYLPYGLVVFVAWAGGVVFTLNPLGDQGAVLPTTLLSDVTGRRFVAAHVLAGLLVAVPVGTVLVAVAGVLSPLDPERVALLVVATPVAMVGAGALSVGIGTAFPRFEATSVTRSMEAVVPSPWAFALLSVYLVLTVAAVGVVAAAWVRPVAASLVSTLLNAVLPVEIAVAPGRLYLVSAGLLVVLLALPLVSYRYAVRTFDGYVLD